MSIDFTESLIQEVQNRPLLYLLRHPDFRNKTKKRQAWKEIQEEINEDVDVLKTKWKNLKDTYRKYKQSKQSTQTQAVKKLKNWTWADHMSFIEPSVTLNETESSITLPSESGDNATPSNSDGEDKDPKDRQNNKSTQESGLKETQNALQRYRRRRRNQNPTDRIKNLQNRRQSKNASNLKNEKVDVKCDGLDLLFLGYADSFKKLSKRRQVKVKFDIAKILMDAELNDLDTPTSASYTAPGISYSVQSDTFMRVPFKHGNYTMIGDGTVRCFRRLYS